MDGVYYDWKGNLIGIEMGEETMEGYKERMVKEYQELRRKQEKLHRILVKCEAGTLDFELNCPVDLLRKQEWAMVEYLNILELRAEIEHVDIYNEQPKGAEA